MLKTILTILTVSLISFSCSKTDEQQNTVKENKSQTTEQKSPLSQKGKEIFYASSNLTGLKCADCHSDGTNASNANTKYFADVIQAHKRNSVFAGTISGEEVKKTGAGATICWETYLKMGRPITAEEIDALNAYFESLPGEVKDNLITTIALPKPDKIKLKENQNKIAGLTPDIANGERIFKETCNFCHGGKTVKRVPSLFEDFEGNLKSIVYHIRFGSKFMPFYSYEKISDQDIADIAKYILSNQKK
jgi:cytochrome c